MHEFIPVFIVISSFFVAVAVYFNRKPLFMTIKIKDISKYWMLAPEF